MTEAQFARFVAGLAGSLAAALAIAADAPVAPSDAHLRQVAFDLYPAVMGRDGLEAPFVMGVILDGELRVVRHSAALPPKGPITAGMLTEIFPRQKVEDCESSGLTVLRKPRGVGGQFDKGFFSVWCVLRPGGK